VHYTKFCSEAAAKTTTSAAEEVGEADRDALEVHDRRSLGEGVWQHFPTIRAKGFIVSVPFVSLATLYRTNISSP
jgi:hypothetical protein